MKRLSLMVVGGLLILSGCSGSTPKEFSDTEGKFTVMMPGKPDKKVQQAHGLTLTMFGSNVSNGAFAIGYADVPPGMPFDIAGCAGGVASTHGGKVLTNQAITHDGLRGQEFEVSVTTPKKGYCSGRAFMVGRRFYQVLAIGTDYQLSKPQVKSFLESFKVQK